jgi:hypothetical protein
MIDSRSVMMYDVMYVRDTLCVRCACVVRCALCAVRCALCVCVAHNMVLRGAWSGRFKEEERRLHTTFHVAFMLGL